VTTEQHPRVVPTSIYHVIIVEGRLLRSDGTVVDADLSDDVAVRPEQLTRVFAAGGAVRAWAVDLHVDGQGRPYAAFSVHSSRDEYWYARSDGAAWRAHFLAHAGSALYAGEAYYTGLVALDPADPGRVVASTDVHPATGAPLISAADGELHHELFEGSTTDGGAAWEWAAITADSTVDNLRPIVPIWDGDQSARCCGCAASTPTTTTTTSTSPQCAPSAGDHTREGRGHQRGSRRPRRPPARTRIRRTTSVVSAVLTWTSRERSSATAVITNMRRPARHPIHPPDGGWSKLALPHDHSRQLGPRAHAQLAEHVLQI